MKTTQNQQAKDLYFGNPQISERNSRRGRDHHKDPLPMDQKRRLGRAAYRIPRSTSYNGRQLLPHGR